MRYPLPGLGASTRRLVLPFLFAVWFGATAPLVAAEGAWLTVLREGKSPVELDEVSLKSIPTVTVQVLDESGARAEYTGVMLGEILSLAGVERGKALRGARLAEYVVVEAADGYRALFSLVELDPAFRSKPVILSYLRDGLPLPENEGRLRLVVSDEDRRGRWVRQVVNIRTGHLP